MKAVDRVPELIQEIMAGSLDAAIIEDTVAQGYLEKNQELKASQLKMQKVDMPLPFRKKVN